MRFVHGVREGQKRKKVVDKGVGMAVLHHRRTLEAVHWLQ